MTITNASPPIAVTVTPHISLGSLISSDPTGPAH